ncbi:MAG: hypothetical protein ABH829_04325 [archaeon]
MASLKSASSRIVKEAIGLRKDEKLLIFTDKAHRSMFISLYEEARKISGHVYLTVVDGGDIEIKKGYRTAAFYGKKVPLSLDDPKSPVKPGDRLIDECKSADIVIYGISGGEDIVKGEVRQVWALLLSKNFDDTRKKYPRHLKEEDATRCVPMPGITEKMYTTLIDIDYKEIQKNCETIRDLLNDKENVRIRTPAGTDIKVSLVTGKKIRLFGGKSKVDLSNGDITKVKNMRNLPGGETFWEPVDYMQASGVVVIDGLSGMYKEEETGGILDGPIRFEVQSGRILEGTIEAVDPARDDATEWMKEFVAGEPNDRGVLFEVGIGTNPNASIYKGTTLLEAEKAVGTCHLGFGSKTHCDYLMYNPAIYIGDKLILQGTSGINLKGKWVISK